MGLWDLLKRWLGGGAIRARSVLAESALEWRLHALVLRRIAAREAFSAVEVAIEALGIPSPHNVQVAVGIVEKLFRDDVLGVRRYRRALRADAGIGLLFHPAELPEADALRLVAARGILVPPPPAPAPLPVWGAAAASGTVPSPSRAPAPPPRTIELPNPYEAAEILGLSAEEMRRRALRIDPFRTAWIGRVDTIPPQSDERTALIDRGLILRGYLTPGQVTEIHRVGDLWLRHHDAVRLAEAVARATAERTLEEERKRKAEIKERKRQESAERRARRAAEVARRRAEDIVFLGRGVSRGLADRRSLVPRLEERGLPVLSSPADVAHALGVTVPRLRGLAFHSEAATRTHYVQFEIPKRSGGTRLLSAPHRGLAAAQRWILENVLERLPCEDPAHGFVKGRSTVSNAGPHLGRDLVVNLDLTDFFPTITFPRVRGFFQRLGYSPAVSTVLALLTTEAPRQEVQHDGVRFFVATGDRGLPQGACTSPALSNQVSRRLDRRLRGMASRRGWTYTRYADDLTFSAPAGHRGEVPMLLARVRHILEEEGFALNPRKGRVQRAAGRQSVTGIVVNDRLALPRSEVRRLRAILHGARRTGLAGQNRENRPHFEAWLRGKLAYLAMVDRPRGLAMLRELDAILGR